MLQTAHNIVHRWEPGSPDYLGGMKYLAEHKIKQLLHQIDLDVIKVNDKIALESAGTAAKLKKMRAAVHNRIGLKIQYINTWVELGKLSTSLVIRMTSEQITTLMHTHEYPQEWPHESRYA